MTGLLLIEDGVVVFDLNVVVAEEVVVAGDDAVVTGDVAVSGDDVVVTGDVVVAGDDVVVAGDDVVVAGVDVNKVVGKVCIVVINSTLVSVVNMLFSIVETPVSLKTIGTNCGSNVVEATRSTEFMLKSSASGSKFFGSRVSSFSLSRLDSNSKLKLLNFLNTSVKMSSESSLAADSSSITTVFPLLVSSSTSSAGVANVVSSFVSSFL